MMNIILLFGVIFLVKFRFVAANFEEVLLTSMENAMKCPGRSGQPPDGPVLAMTPRKYSQLVALLKRNTGTPTCDRHQQQEYFNVHDENTWSFCVFGTCQDHKCQCLHGYTGSKCASYTRRCWMLYCFLSSCNPELQTIYCRCDPTLYGRSVISGDYWYEEGLFHEFVHPPPGWRDDSEVPAETSRGVANLYSNSDRVSKPAQDQLLKYGKSSNKHPKTSSQIYNPGHSRNQQPAQTSRKTNQPVNAGAQGSRITNQQKARPEMLEVATEDIKLAFNEMDSNQSSGTNFKNTIVDGLVTICALFMILLF